MDYCDPAADLDAREILRYLNNLGIQNISGEVLKYFITDLKKLIRYDTQQKEDKAIGISRPEPSGPERLHSASTFSSRIRSRYPENTPISCDRDCQIKIKSVRNIHSAPILRQMRQENVENAMPARKSCSCIRVEKKPETALKDKSPSSNNLIKVQRQQTRKKSDPVALYHYYNSLWAKFKPNVPGENNWADLRWSVRQKMAGNKPAINKASSMQLKVDLNKNS